MNLFNQRKKSILEKKDKSAKKSWDEKIAPLCDLINSSSNYYTTSSCSGKSVIMKEKVGKDGSYYFWQSHELINLIEIKSKLNKLPKKGIFKYKFDGPIIFVVCKDIESAKKIFSLAILAGFKESGIKITNKLFGVEIKSGEKLEFPVSLENKIFVNDDFLRIIVELSNKKKKIGWKKIENFYSSMIFKNN